MLNAAEQGLRRREGRLVAGRVDLIGSCNFVQYMFVFVLSPHYRRCYFESGCLSVCRGRKSEFRIWSVYRLVHSVVRKHCLLACACLAPRKQASRVEYKLKAIVADYSIWMYRKGFPIPVKFLPSLAFVVRCHSSSTFQIPSADDSLQTPGKNWSQGFQKRHPEVAARKLKALDWNRHDLSTYDKITEWFTVIGKELDQPTPPPDGPPRECVQYG